MTKPWKITISTVGAIQIIFGIIIIYFNVKLILHVLELIKDFNDLDREITGFDVFKRYQFMLVVGLLFIIAGILLILSKKIGWVTSLSVWITFAFSFVSLLFFKDVTTTVLYENNSEYWFYGCMIVVIVASVTILLLKPIREHYRVTSKSWLYVGGILVCFLLHKILI
jgi:hypothetical protein